MKDIAILELKRLSLQKQLDSLKKQSERNRLGQFATPFDLAQSILQETKCYFEPTEPIRFLDPAFGTGVFYSALLATYDERRIEWAEGYEIDSHYGDPAEALWQAQGLRLHIADFTRAAPPEERVNLLVCNPPYVRHHHISAENKQYLREKTGRQLSGLSGLYCYFLLIAHDWLADNGIGCWLIPNEWMDVNYGRQIKRFLTTAVDLLRVHRFAVNSLQFEDALVSSTVVWFRKTAPKLDVPVCFSSGSSLENPAWKKEVMRTKLDHKAKWSQIFRDEKRQQSSDSAVLLSHLFDIKRGIATGANKFFILSSDQIAEYQLPTQFLKPILPSPRYLEADEILANDKGDPSIDKRLFLLDCPLPEQKIQTKHPNLWKYLQLGREQKIDQRYLCRHRIRWYQQEVRPPAPLLCTYMGRNARPFRFIRNHSIATAPNVYLMLYPTPLLQRHLNQNVSLLQNIWVWLTQVRGETLKQIGRSYGGGLFKVEPKELAQLRIDRQIISNIDIVPQPVQIAFSF